MHQRIAVCLHFLLLFVPIAVCLLYGIKFDKIDWHWTIFFFYTRQGIMKFNFKHSRSLTSTVCSFLKYNRISHEVLLFILFSFYNKNRFAACFFNNHKIMNLILRKVQTVSILLGKSKSISLLQNVGIYSVQAKSISIPMRYHLSAWLASVSSQTGIESLKCRLELVEKRLDKLEKERTAEVERSSLEGDKLWVQIAALITIWSIICVSFFIRKAFFFQFVEKYIRIFSAFL